MLVSDGDTILKNMKQFKNQEKIQKETDKIRNKVALSMSQNEIREKNIE